MKLVVCNLKNRMDSLEFKKYAEDLKTLDSKGNTVIVALSNIFLLSAPFGRFQLASQDITSLIDAVVTGEVTGHQLASCGVKYTIVGHSERRISKKEINIDFINKITEAQNNGIKVIYCIGETLSEKENGETEKVLEQQILEVLNNVELKDIIIAYEPVWAIGSGKIPNVEELDTTIKYIKDTLRKNYDLNFKVLYGGSITEENVDTFKDLNVIDGYLIGGASLKVASIQNIIDKISTN